MWRLVWKNVWRNKRRTLLTLSSITVSLFLLSSLAMVYTAFGNPTGQQAPGARLMVRRSTGIVFAIPSSYERRILEVPGVAACTAMNFFGAYYVDPKNSFANFAIGQETVFDVYNRGKLPPEQLAAFKRERTAAVAGRQLAQRFGWKLGDRITLLGSFYGVTPELTLRGIYQGTRPEDEDMFFFHWDYFNELTGRQNLVNNYWVRVDKPESAASVAQAIDARFRNTPYETKTETESQFLLGFISMLGNVRGIILLVGSAVTFAVLLIVANSMAMSVRERIPEAALMRSLGFRPSQVVRLFVAEALLLTLAGWTVGCGGAKLLYDALGITQVAQIAWADLRLRPENMALVFSLALLIGLAASGWPAYRAARSNIAESLRYLG